MEEKTITLQIQIKLSEQTYSHVKNIENLHELLKRNAEKLLYKFVLEDLD